MPQNFNSWSKSIVYIRLAFSVVGLAIMLFFSVVSSDGRPVTVAAAIGLLLFIYWNVRVMGSWRRTPATGSGLSGVREFPPAKAVISDSSDIRAQLIAIWRVHVATGGAQLLGGVFAWYLEPLQSTIADIWLGMALASLPGFLFGIALQRLSSDQWRRTPGTILWAYFSCAALITFVGAPLGIVVFGDFW